MVMAAYTFGDYRIRPDMMEPLQAYIEEHRPVGGFLSAVISNDLSRACSRADEDNLRNLPAFVAFLYNAAPSTCWGSPEKMKKWLEEPSTE